MGTTGSFSSLFLFRIRDFMLNRNYFVTSIIAGTSKRFPFVVTAKILGVITPSQNQIKALYIV